MQGGHALVIKRHLSTDQDIQHDTKTPDIYFRPRIRPSLQKFWCSKVQAPTEGLQMALGGKQIAQAEINDLDVSSLADQDVLNLEVSVYDAIPMAIVERARNLPAELSSLLLL
jgi:hypothetical protein